MSHGVQGAGDGDVVQIMAGRLRQRTVLPPAGHASVHQPRIARQAFVGPQAQPFHDARPEPFEQGVGLVQQPQYDIGRAGLLEVQRDRAAASVDDGAAAAQESGREPVNADHVRAHVRQHHGAERAGAYAGHFHYRLEEFGARVQDDLDVLLHVGVHAVSGADNGQRRQLAAHAARDADG
ncbi:hypothetical protein G6F35_015362 [Rhizopus arrhizus]|nr:hypothetical protein G6F35_015362 [Rhizopus arrhizus]